MRGICLELLCLWAFFKQSSARTCNTQMVVYDSNAQMAMQKVSDCPIFVIEFAVTTQVTFIQMIPKNILFQSF